MDYRYNAEVIRIVDGDTVVLRVFNQTTIDFGFHVKQAIVQEYTGNFRLAHIDTPEPRGRKAKPKEAKAATDRLTELLDSAQRIIAQTYKDPDNFGRYLVELIIVVPDTTTELLKEVNVNETLVSEGLAVPYRR